MSAAEKVNRLAAYANTVGEFLALNDFPELRLTDDTMNRVFGRRSCDLLLLCGNSVLATAEAAFMALQAGHAGALLIAGGIGHSTSDLYAAVSQHDRYRNIETANKAEAVLLAEIGLRSWGLSRDQLIIESESSNCGQNASFAFRLIQQRGLPADSIVLIQDPTMQRRTDATARKVWCDGGQMAHIANFPVFVPRLTAEAGELSFADQKLSFAWTIERYLSLLLGEIPRLHDNLSGYGPKGKNFILHVDIPDEIVSAHAELTSAFPHLVRRIQ